MLLPAVTGTQGTHGTPHHAPMARVRSISRSTKNGSKGNVKALHLAALPQWPLEDGMWGEGGGEGRGGSKEEEEDDQEEEEEGEEKWQGYRCCLG